MFIEFLICPNTQTSHTDTACYLVDKSRLIDHANTALRKKTDGRFAIAPCITEDVFALLPIVSIAMIEDIFSFMFSFF